MTAYENEDDTLTLASVDDGMVVFAPSSVRFVKHDVPEVARSSGLPITWEGGVPAAPAASLGRTTQLRLKRLFDIVIALMGLIVLGPLLLLVALAVKFESRGPVLFVQNREGLNGQSFRIFKFRSMRVDAGDITGVKQTVEGDPRVTAVGRFIRKTSIDELPQLLNVLFGDMSIVGPRPHVPGMLAAGVQYSSLVPYYTSRLAMRPGITGWAQANGLRGGTDLVSKARARVDHDVAYVQNFSLWLDFKIVLLTVRNEFLTGSGN